MKKFEIWIEGYSCTGESAGAKLLGVQRGKNFKDACQKFMQKFDPKNKQYDVERNTYWSCELFDNVFDAKEKFG